MKRHSKTEPTRQRNTIHTLRTAIRDGIEAFQALHKGEIDPRRAEDIRSIEKLIERTHRRAILISDIEEVLDQIGIGLSIFGKRFFDNQRYDLLRYIKACMREESLERHIQELEGQNTALQTKINRIEVEHGTELDSIRQRGAASAQVLEHRLELLQADVDHSRSNQSKIHDRLHALMEPEDTFALSPRRKSTLPDSISDEDGAEASLRELKHMKEAQQTIFQLRRRIGALEQKLSTSKGEGAPSLTKTHLWRSKGAASALPESAKRQASRLL